RLDVAFPGINIRLVKENITADSWDPDCTIMDTNGAPFETTNTAAQYYLGVTLIEAIKHSKGLPDLPILLDDTEHFDDVPVFNTQSQIIMCYVERKTTEAVA
ncbi:MAG: hypothetical protein Q8N15_04100, partial [Bacillota bacterium]|nr:hypothetical protein [Bacillota bacterium]